MSATPTTTSGVAAEGSKKRKRTGKEREERKKAALEAQQNADRLLAEARGEVAVSAAEQGAPAHQHRAEVEDVGSEATIPAGSEVEAVEEPGQTVQLEGEGEGEGQKGPDVQGIVKRIPQALKSLHPVFKKAKAFESGRLIKKIRSLKGKDAKSAELADLEAQLELMHRIQLHDLAQSHLHLKLSKHHHFKHTSLPTSISALLTPPTGPSSTAASSSAAPSLTAKVENRLTSNKSVAESVKSVLAWTIGEDGAKLGGAGKMQPRAVPVREDVEVDVQVADEQDEEEAGEGGEGEEDDEMDIHRSGLRAAGEEEEDEDEVDEEDAAADAAGWESGSIGGDEVDSGDESVSDGEEGESDVDSGVIEWSDADRYTGADSDDDDEKNDGTGSADSDAEGAAGEADGAETDGSSSFIAAPPSKRAKASPSTHASSSKDVSASTKAVKHKLSTTSASTAPVSASAATAKPTKEGKPTKEPKNAKSAKIDKNITSSLFLPSLSVGFAAGGDSDSDPDLDADVDGSGLIGKKGVRERKNRRGQRARQAIWEKKYGKNAKHVVKNAQIEHQKAEEKVQSATKNAYARRGQLASDPYTASGGQPSAAPAATAAGGNANGYVPKKKTLNPNANIVDDKPKPATTAGSGGGGSSSTQGLHPSWAAAKMRQKQLAEGPKATKITFD